MKRHLSSLMFYFAVFSMLWVGMPSPVIASFLSARATTKNQQRQRKGIGPVSDACSVRYYLPLATDGSFRMSGITARQQKTNDDELVLIQRRRPHLVFPGGGIFFYWQAGVVTYLREQGYDMTKPTATGASAGALTATLTATGVDFYKATELALEQARYAGVWKRKQGLQGIWGDLIYEWLDQLLPSDAVGKVNSSNYSRTSVGTGSSMVEEAGKSAKESSEPGLSLLVTPVQKLIVGANNKDIISDFANREDLIQCNLASIHIPWFLDGKLTRTFRERPHIDGSFLARTEDYHPQANSDTDSRQSYVLTVNHNLDLNYKAVGFLDFVSTVSPDGIWAMLEDGKKYAQYLEETGQLSFLPKTSS